MGKKLVRMNAFIWGNQTFSFFCLVSLLDISWTFLRKFFFFLLRRLLMYNTGCVQLYNLFILWERSEGYPSQINMLQLNWPGFSKCLQRGKLLLFTISVFLDFVAIVSCFVLGSALNFVSATVTARDFENQLKFSWECKTFNHTIFFRAEPH